MTGWRHSKIRRQSAILLTMLCIVVPSAHADEPVISSASGVVGEQKKTFDPQMLEALRKKMPTTSEPAGSGKRGEYDHYSGPTPPITVNEIEALRMKLNGCYDGSVLASDPNADDLFASLRFRLARDGAVIGTPEIEDTGPGRSGDLAVLARNAILQCAPYDTLPRDKYGSWKDVVATFSVNGMQ